MRVDIAIIICAHNPDSEIFSVVLAAVRRLRIPRGLVVQCVLVDNCSAPALSTRNEVVEFLAAVPWGSIVLESTPGLTCARLAGIKSTDSRLVIFIDDDNEPANDYLEAAVKCLDEHPDIFALGPGEVNVRFLGQVSETFVTEYSSVFQARRSPALEYACVAGAQMSCYPYGTGLILRREVLDKWASAVLGETLNIVGRQGRRLSSGEDLQIVWEAIKMGRAAGVSPALRMAHIVPSARSNPEYLARVLYGTGSSYLPAFCQSFPELAAPRSLPRVRIHVVIWRLGRIAVRCLVRRRWNCVRAEMAKFLGPIAGQLRVQNRKPSHWLFALARRLELE